MLKYFFIVIILQTIVLIAAKTSKDDLVPYPDVFIIGVQKCGTTSLNKLLFEHPQICSEGVKEKHFYSLNNYLDPPIIQEYLSQFSKCRKNQITVDATPSYISKPDAAERINASYSSLSMSKKKFIVLLRDPVARHYSEYQRNLRICFRAIDGDEELDRDSGTRSSEEKIERANLRCRVALKPNSKTLKKENALTFAEWTASPYGGQEIRRGRYLNDITKWLTIIDRSQIFIMNFQSVVSNTTDVITRLSNFLEIDPKVFYNNAKDPIILLPAPPPSNSYVEWARSYMDCPTFDKLDRLFKRENEGLIELINNAPNKPKEEPLFPQFSSIRSKCVNPTKSGIIKNDN